ncbi:PREDICTED: protein SRG1-like [Fragaria vesca subsp. vesca]
MVRTDPFQVPERYIRDEKDVANDADLCSQLSDPLRFPPLIFLSTQMGTKRSFTGSTRLARNGMVNHGVATEFTKGMKDSAKKFFELPLEEKNKIAMPPNDIQGYGHSHADQILDCLGLSPHSDKGSLAILMQEEDVVGLQIKHNGKWVPINPLANAFIVNVGDIIGIWSNGKYKSIEHRVVTNESKARISYSTFYLPHRDVDIEPLDQMVLESPGSLPLYKKVT